MSCDKVVGIATSYGLDKQGVGFRVAVILFIGILGSGVQLGPLGTAATNRPIVPAPGDYDGGEIGGMMIGRGNRSTRRKPASVPLCPPQTPHAAPGANPSRRGGKPETNRLSYGTAFSSPGKVKHFLLFMSSRPALWSTQIPIQCVPRALSH
jgi:hypothetical protein